MDYYANIGIKIKALREKNNMTLAELSDGICSKSHISRIENGSRIPNALILRQLSNKLGVSVDILLRSVESPLSLELLKVITQIRIDLEYNRFEKVYEATKKIDIDQVLALEDRLVVEGMLYVSKNAIYSIPEETLGNLRKTLSYSYSEGSLPNNLEFALLIEISYCNLQLDNLEEATRTINFLYEIQNEVIFYLTTLPFVKIHLAKAILSFHSKDYEQTLEGLDIAIYNAKLYCHYGILNECFYFKSKVYDLLGDSEQAKMWLSKTTVLKSLLFDTEETHYRTHIEHLL